MILACLFQPTLLQLQITRANEALANWICDNGYGFDGESFCIYHVSPHDAASPEDLVTEVCYPVKKK